MNELQLHALHQHANDRLESLREETRVRGLLKLLRSKRNEDTRATEYRAARPATA